MNVRNIVGSDQFTHSSVLMSSCLLLVLPDPNLTPNPTLGSLDNQGNSLSYYSVPIGKPNEQGGRVLLLSEQAALLSTTERLLDSCALALALHFTCALHSRLRKRALTLRSTSVGSSLAVSLVNPLTLHHESFGTKACMSTGVQLSRSP